MLLDGVSGGLAGAIGLALADVSPVTRLRHHDLYSEIHHRSGLRRGVPQGHPPQDLPHRQQAQVRGRRHGVGLQRPAGQRVHRPFIGYFRNLYIFGQPAEFVSVVTKIASGVTLVNSLLSTVCAVVLYIALRPALEKAHLLPKE